MRAKKTKVPESSDKDKVKHFKGEFKRMEKLLRVFEKRLIQLESKFEKIKEKK